MSSFFATAIPTAVDCVMTIGHYVLYELFVLRLVEGRPSLHCIIRNLKCVRMGEERSNSTTGTCTPQ